MEDPVPTYTYIANKLAERHLSLAFLDLVEPGVKGAGDGDAVQGQVSIFRKSPTSLTTGKLTAFSSPTISFAPSGHPDLS